MENEMENIEVTDQETVCQPEETICPTEETAEIVQPAVEETSAPKKRSTLTIVAISVAATLLIVALALGLTVGVLAGAELIDPEKWFDKNPAASETEDQIEEQTEEAESGADGSVVVGTIGDETLTNGELQVYYAYNLINLLQSDYAYYLYYYYGIDLTQPLDELVYDETTGQTWKDLVTENAILTWHEITAMNLQAQEEGFQLTAEQQEYVQTLDTKLEEMAKSAGYDSVEAMVKADFGATATVEALKKFMVNEYFYSCYFNTLQEKLAPTQEQIETYFTENEQSLAEQGITKETYTVDVRHILINPEGGTTDENGSPVYSDEEWEACRKKAQEILDTWKAGEATEDSFAALAMEHSADGNASEGGIYTGMTVNDNLVEPFKEWIFDESREFGNTDLVKTLYGYHVMFFVGKTYTWSDHCANTLLSDSLQYVIDTAKEKYPMQIDYSLISLN